MSAQILDLVQAALCAQLKTPDLTDPATPIAWSLVSYIPTVGTSYLEVHPMLKAATQHVSLSFDGSDIDRGIFQVDAVIPDGKGEAPGLRLAGLVAARFPIGLALVAGGYKLQIYAPSQMAAAVRDAAWVRFPVSIPYRIIT